MSQAGPPSSSALAGPGPPPPPSPAGPQLSAMLGGLRVAELRTVLRACGDGGGKSSLRRDELVALLAAMIDVREAHPAREAAARLIHAAHAMKVGLPDPYGGSAAAALVANAVGSCPMLAEWTAAAAGAAGGGGGGGGGGGAGPSPVTAAAAATAATPVAPPGPGPGPRSAARPAPPPGRGPGGAAAATPGGGGGGGGGAAPATRIRCLCGDHADKGTPMLQCAVCGVWQHAACALPQQPGAQPPPTTPPFACEACRLADADPFWVAATPSDCPGLVGCTAYDAAPLTWRGAPAMLPPHADPGSGLVAADRSITLSAAAVAALTADPSRLRLQVACVGLGDGPAWPGTAAAGRPGGGGVPGRCHWPRFIDARVNNAAVPPATRRHPHDPLTARGRDPAVDVPPGLLRVGANRIYVGGLEPPGRRFAVVARLVAARPLSALAAAPPPPEPLAAALARVRAAVAGDDPDLIVDSAPLSLRCPLSGGRFTTPVRLAGPGGGLVAFDWGSFLEVGSRSRRWVCPHSMRPAPVRLLVGDGYIAAVLRALDRESGGGGGGGGMEVVEVEVAADGRWRAGPGGAWRSILEEEGGGGGAGAAASAPPAAAAPVVPPPPPPAAAVKAEAAATPSSPAAAAAPAAAGGGGGGGGGRARPRPAADVILISSSDDDSGGDDDEDIPLAARGAARGAPSRRLSSGGGGLAGGLAGGAAVAAAAATPQAARPPPPPPPPRPPVPASGIPAPIRVSLPTRSRPAVDAAAAAAAAAAEARGREGAAVQRLLASFVAALTQADPAGASPDRGATVRAAAAELVASGAASPRRAADLAGRAFDAAADTLRVRSGGGGWAASAGGGGRPSSAPTPPAERAAAAAAAAAARARLASDAGARARVTAMAVGAAAARLPSGGGGG